jgi:ABC-2 type transport system permease protein
MNDKMWVVARREFLATVKRKAYLITTIGMPVFFLLIAGIGSIPALVMARREVRARTVAVVDLAGVLGLEEAIDYPPSAPRPASEGNPLVGLDLQSFGGGVQISRTFQEAGKLKIRPYHDREAALEAVRSEEVSVAYELAPDYIASGRVTRFGQGGILTGSGGESRQATFRRFLVDRLLAKKIDEALLERVRRPMQVESYSLAKDGRFERQDIVKQLGSLLVPIVFGVLFFISVMMSSGFLLEGVSEEKENRVIEVILSSIDSDRLLLGKLIGLGGAGLLQVVIWFGMVLVPAAGLLAQVPVHWLGLAFSFVFYLLGFLLYGILMLGTGSLGQNLKEGQQLGMVWSIGSAVPMMFLMIIVGEPNGVMARTLSFIPLTAPMTMFLRLASEDAPPWWESILAAAVLAGAVLLALKAMSKLFRVGLLLYGKRPTIPEILRVIRRPKL